MNGEVLGERDGWRVRLGQEEYVDDPRKEWDHLATMICFHKRYTLGDDHSYDPDTVLEDIKEEYPDGVFMLPLYLMDHSGLTIRTDSHDFRMCDSVGWDWGCLGFIMVPKVRARNEYGDLPDDELEARAKSLMRNEVEEYDQYLTGDVWYCVVESQCDNERCGCWIVEESCGWLYGREYAEEEALRMFEEWIEQAKKESEQE